MIIFTYVKDSEPQAFVPPLKIGETYAVMLACLAAGKRQWVYYELDSSGSRTSRDIDNDEEAIALIARLSRVNATLTVNCVNSSSSDMGYTSFIQNTRYLLTQAGHDVVSIAQSAIHVFKPPAIREHGLSTICHELQVLHVDPAVDSKIQGVEFLMTPKFETVSLSDLEGVKTVLDDQRLGEVWAEDAWHRFVFFTRDKEDTPKVKALLSEYTGLKINVYAHSLSLFKK